MTQTPAASAARNETREQTRGVYVIVALVILTALEFAAAMIVNRSAGLVAALTPFALAKAGLIIHYFMHGYRLWRGEEEHE